MSRHTSHKLTFVRRVELFRDVVVRCHQICTWPESPPVDTKAETGRYLGQPKKSVVKVEDLGRSKSSPNPLASFAEDYINGRGDVRFHA